MSGTTAPAPPSSSSSSSSSLENRLQQASNAYQKLQAELATAVDARQRLDAQLTETTVVKKEFESLKPENTVYKFMGPVLVPQEQAEAKANVDKRLEFIKSELKRIDAQVKDLSEKSEKRRAEIVEIQTAHQAAQQKGAAAPASTPVSVT